MNTLDMAQDWLTQNIKYDFTRLGFKTAMNTKKHDAESLSKLLDQAFEAGKRESK